MLAVRLERIEGAFKDGGNRKFWTAFEHKRRLCLGFRHVAERRIASGDASMLHMAKARGAFEGVDGLLILPRHVMGMT